ncbi:MAG: hypothetical protein HC819_13140 [Cyclobacteriaceae bacterium]|nr:hypothetical protein [Cyclobacteriaceae bacterium]
MSASTVHGGSSKNNLLWKVLIFFSLYAVLRYLVFKGVALIHFPLYIVNKILSISGIFFLALSYVTGKSIWPIFEDAPSRNQFVKYCGLAGFSLIAMHVFISLIILTPAYFPKFYQDDMMNLTGEVSMLMGVVSLYFFSIPAITTIPFMQEAVGIQKWQKGQRMGYFGLVTSLLHVGAMGLDGWIKWQLWPGYMPPISLLAAILVCIPLYYKLAGKAS